MPDHTPRRKAYSYLRFSSQGQAKGDSFRRQTELSRKYAEEHGLDLDESTTFQDLGISAFRGSHIERGALGDFLAAVEAGAIPAGSVLLVESLDRLSRDKILTALSHFTALLERELEIVTFGDGAVYTKEAVNENPLKLLVSITIMQRAHEESVTKSKRISAAWEARRRRAREQGGELMARCPAWLKYDKVKRRFLPIPERAAVVKRIYELANGGCGAVVIARRLNGEGIPAFGRSIRGWHSSYIKKILDSETVVGTYQPHKIDETTRERTPEGPPIPNFYPSVVDESLYMAVRDRNRIVYLPKGRQDEYFSNLFTGLCRCRLCGSPMVYINKGSGLTYLVCGRSQNGSATHDYAALPYQVVQSIVVQALFEIKFPEHQPHTQDGRLRALQLELAEKKLQLERKQAHLINLFKSFQDMISPELEVTTREIQADVDFLRTTVNDIGVEIESIMEGSKAMKDTTSELPYAMRTLFTVEQNGSKEDKVSTRRKFNLMLRKMGVSIELEHIKHPKLEYYCRVYFMDDTSNTLNIRGFKREKKARTFWEVGFIPRETTKPEEVEGIPSCPSYTLGDFGKDDGDEYEDSMTMLHRMIYGFDWPPTGVIAVIDEFCPEDVADRIWKELPKIAGEGFTDVSLRHARFIFHRQESSAARCDGEE